MGDDDLGSPLRVGSEGAAPLRIGFDQAAPLRGALGRAAPLRVAFVMPGVGVVRRGAEAFVVELCAALGERHGFDVTLFCRGPAPVPHRRIHALPRDGRLLNRVYAATRLGRKVLDTLFLDPLNLEWDTAALSALPALWSGGFDVIAMEGGLAGGWICRLLRRTRGVPFVDIAHGLDPKWEGAFARQRPDRVVTFTAAAARELGRLAPRAAITVIPHGIDLERFHPGAAPVALSLPRPVILAAGALDAHKRMELALAAVERLPGASLVVLGEGPGAAELDRLALAWLGEARYLRRVVPREEMPSWYAAADCFTLPSRSESFGLAYLEALACGLPCVAPDDEVRREVLGEAGLFCRVEDVAGYAAALEAALSRPPGGWREPARARAERFPVAATIDSYAALLAELAGRSGRRV